MTQSSHLALVLSGGGARGAYQAGALAAIAEGCGGEHPFQILTGVSAGAINTAYLAGFGGPFLDACRDLSRAWMTLSLENVFRSDFPTVLGSGTRWLRALVGGGRLAPKLEGLLDTSPLRRFLTENLDLRRIDRNLSEGRLRAVGLSATSYSTGRTVTFVQGHPSIEMWERSGRYSLPTTLTVDHVLASSALPLIFPAIRVGDEYYGDGSIRQSSPLAPSIHLGADKILSISVGYRRTPVELKEQLITSYPPPVQILGLLFNSIFLDSLEADAERLDRVNRTLGMLSPGQRHPEGLRPLRFLMLRPSKNLGGLSKDLFKELPRPFQSLVRALGANQSKSPDLLSYLLFEPPYVERLIELGYRDVQKRWGEIERFLES